MSASSTAARERVVLKRFARSLLAHLLGAGLAGGPALALHAQSVARDDVSSGAAYSAEAEPILAAPGPVLRAAAQPLVTPRKRAEPIERTPVSLTALSDEQLARRNQRRLSDLNAQVPNLLVDTALGTANSARLSLRGLSENEPTASSDPTVGIYVDGVYRSRLQGSLLTLYDVERIEVLRGPQGALFGKNTIGGAINVITRRPEFSRGGGVEVRAGNFNAVETRATLNVPLVAEKAAARLSIASASRDGYVRNQLNGDDYADNKFLGGRLQLAALPGENVELRLIAESTREDRKPLAGKCVPTGKGFGLAGILARDSGTQDACRRGARSSELKTAQDVSFITDELRTHGISGEITWDISPATVLTSISGYRRQEGRLLSDLDATPVPFLESQGKSGRNLQRQWSQELQLKSSALDGKLSFVLGAFGLVDQGSEGRFQGLGFAADPASGSVVRFPALTRTSVKVDNVSYALYGQGVYALTDRLDLTLGARLTEERKRVRAASRLGACLPSDASGCAGLLGRPPADFPGFRRSSRFGDLSPMATLAYSFRPELLLYTTYSTGFQGGGFDGLATQKSDTGELAEQQLTSYEVGLKASAFDRRLVLNAAAFYNLLEDQRVQFTALGDDGRNLAVSQRSAAETVLRGGELELSALPLPGLQLIANAGAVDADFDDFNSEVPLSLRGRHKRQAGVPNYTGYLAVDYELPPTRVGSVGLRASWTHRGSLHIDPQGTKALEAGKAGLLDGRISLGLPDAKTELALFGSNLLDRRYFANGMSFQESFGFVTRFFGPPRMYGIELRRRF